MERDEPLQFEGIDDDNENGIGTAKLSTDESNAFDLLVTSRAIPESGNYVSHGHDALYVDTGGLQPPQRSRNNSLFLDGINTQVVPTPTFISSFSTTWGNYENLFDVSVPYHKSEILFTFNRRLEAMDHWKVRFPTSLRRLSC